MRNNSSGCLTAFVSAFSRIMLLMIWIARPIAWNACIRHVDFPCLGFLFLPFTTLMYFVLLRMARVVFRVSIGCGSSSPCSWTSAAGVQRATRTAITCPEGKP